MAALVPQRSRSTPTAPGLRGELRRLPLRPGLAVPGITVLGFGGMFGAFTYIAYTLTEVSGFASAPCRGC